MKKTILFLLILSIGILSCNTEKTQPVVNNGKTILKNNLTIDDLINFLPMCYFDESTKLIFKDELSNEKSFSLSIFEWKNNPFETNAIKYTYDAFQIDLIPDDNSNFFLTIKGSAGYNEQDNIQANSLDYMLIKKGDLVGDGLTLEFIENKLQANSFSAQTKPFIQNGKTYSCAYHCNYSINRFTTDFPFSDIVVTTEDGIIAFNDLDAKRWTLSRIE